MKRFEIMRSYSLHQAERLVDEEDKNYIASTYEEALEKASKLLKENLRSGDVYIVQILTKVSSKTPEDLITITTEEIKDESTIN